VRSVTVFSLEYVCIRTANGSGFGTLYDTAYVKSRVPSNRRFDRLQVRRDCHKSSGGGLRKRGSR
jgi:hypothetical protein